MSKFKARYNKSWEDISFYPDFARWITPVPGDQFLASPIDLSNMGIQALKSHCKGAKYLILAAAICNVKAITSFTTSNQDKTKPDSTAKITEVPTCSKKETLEKSPSIYSYYL